MSVVDSINRIGRRVAWSLYGFVLAAIFGGITVYSEFIRDERPTIRFEVVSNSSVLDVKEEVPNLEVIYAGTDLRKSGQSLRIIVIRVRNVGLEDVLKSYYDEKSPLGFTVSDGSIISVELQDASESYLLDNLEVELASTSQANFSPVILGRDQHFTVKTLIIHAESSIPNIAPTGRIARVSSISAVSSQDLEAPGFWSQVFSGSALVQVVRLPLYFVGLVIAITAIVLPIATTGSAVAKKNRRRKVEKFKQETKNPIPDAFDILFSKYIESGDLIFIQLGYLLSKRANLNYLVEQVENIPDSLAVAQDVYVSHVENEDGRGHHVNRIVYISLVREMLEFGLIEAIDGNYRVKPAFANFCRRFGKFVGSNYRAIPTSKKSAQ